ncbi:hypothetical protein AU184_06560 [Mycolicibacterium novocastrense]|uniref:Secreted protein n=1 Tax=Mycolicibacterium novocastrense TaxID=59813 RepID=A0AAW5STF7_MYCNV|nr:hypothetical protein [Mycolicibacterium novocastrense]KUH67204.1 hypothetical protein AU184_06560 [Mycolicibacterium novocastrense]KUH68156.1 hypothetical protein AU183_04680 [Mycolicibacterium novocastrense]KUH68672.1 hypothetical protein AU072_00720 [Mycolicibacterium novocastrense]MCV7026870.1 hypothetical protein [Mycolicibacterium novocastrense]GAT12911.1 uncharacterized protein RMCN_6044 [Mycolicibacterium novocastrense]
MTSRTGSPRDIWRRIVIGGMAGGVLTVGLLTGVAGPTATAQPAEPTVQSEAPEPQADGPKTPCTGDDCNRAEESAPRVNADQVLQMIHEEYRQGDGGGQVSVLIDDAVKLRRLGFRPSNANAVALKEALEDRPNQTPLVEALKETITHQRKMQARAAQQAAAGGGSIAGIPVTPAVPVPAG